MIISRQVAVDKSLPSFPYIGLDCLRTHGSTSDSGTISAVSMVAYTVMGRGVTMTSPPVVEAVSPRGAPPDLAGEDG